MSEEKFEADSEHFQRFLREVFDPVISEAPPLVSVYAIGDRAAKYATMIAHGIALRNDSVEYQPIEPAYIDAVRADAELLEGKLSVSGRRHMVNRRYQVIVTTSYQDPTHLDEALPETETVYWVGRGIRRIEEKRNARCSGITVASADPSGVIPFHEVTRAWVRNPRLRQPIQDQEVIYGRQARSYVDARLDALTSRMSHWDDPPAVLEPGDREFTAQYLYHRLLDESDGQPEFIVAANGEIQRPTHDGVVIPGMENPALLARFEDQLAGKDILWMDDLEPSG